VATHQDPPDHGTTTANDPTAVTTFVDYRRPPAAKIQPPSKYKLWLLVFVLVYLAVWASEAASLSQALRFRGWLSPDGAQFLELAMVVFVLTYGALDLAVALGTMTIQGKVYGLGPWLQCGKRTQWVHKTQFADYFVMEVLKGAICVLEEGFGMFNAARAVAPPTTADNKQAGRSMSRQKLGSSKDSESTFDHDDDDDDDEQDAPFSCTSNDCETVVKIEHRINPDKMTEYHGWQARIERAAQHAPGLVSIKRMDIVPEEIDHAECPRRGDADIELNNGTFDGTAASLPPQRTLRHSTTSISMRMKTNLHTVYLTFDNIDSLNDWMMSPRRKALMKQLEPLLAVPDQELIQAERAASARDAFTNLIIQQGHCSPSVPPKKWKVCWLTTVALVITIRWVTSFLAYYLEFWRLAESHPRLRSLVSIFITTFLNSYVMTPFLLFLFNPWMHRRSNEVDERFIWKTLDDGMGNMWLKFLLTFAYYGGCIIAWIAQTY
jgi:antibiotic biosynthesis monooxygenase (ABM) superfamily enzyme